MDARAVLFAINRAETFDLDLEVVKALLFYMSKGLPPARAAYEALIEWDL